VYELDRFTWPDLLEALQTADVTIATGDEVTAGADSPQPYVLIIDEINRGNISRILGELITLIEPSKRIGMIEALHVTLPYSKKRFGVPPNIHIIGTMNTADRSLTGLDIALRRRFAFKDMPPQPELLDMVNIEGVNIGKMLRRMNERIEALLDRDHCLGHTYFLSLRSVQNQHREGLAGILRQHIIPLLEEYFFDDAERIGWVLNDPNCPQGVEPFIRRTGAANSLVELFGEDVAGKIQDTRWSVNESALKSIESLRNIIGKSA
jgi:5-methylcytosine-specific restriction protein B